MLFSSMIFLWAFLPTVLILYWMAPSIRLKNIVLLVASLIFYAWGEPIYIFLMLLVVLINYVTALLSVRFGRVALIIGVTGNLMILGYFKYFNFLIGIVNSILRAEKIAPKEIVLPLGISFFTFQAMSYAIDVYRGNVKPCYNFFNVLLYVSLFPQLVAGPIVRYSEVAEEITNRVIDRDEVAYGIKRFCYGLGKKVILSNILAEYADIVFNAENGTFSGAVLWLGTLLYTLQIYYDFSGYSDMAIGLGRMFGFHFSENFRYPYISQSIREFWRRWHISLSTWFREYVYIPLGGNRKGKIRTYINLGIVFFLTGLWHGASFAFVFWGLFHGFFMILERIFLGKLLERNRFRILNHLYTLFVVMIAWVFFRLASFRASVKYLRQMLLLRSGEYGLADFLSLRLIIILILGLVFCGFLQTRVSVIEKRIFDEKQLSVAGIIISFICLAVSCMLLVGGLYNPFIYFRF